MKPQVSSQDAHTQGTRPRAFSVSRGVPFNMVSSHLRLRPEVSVVVCTRNRAQLLEGLLKCLLRQRLADSSSYEIVVVDNASSDETHSVFEQLAVRVDQAARPVRYAYEARSGLSHARNAGIQAAAGEIVAFIDDDCIPQEDWVQRLIDIFKEHPSADVVFGRVEAARIVTGMAGLSINPSPHPREYHVPATPVGFGHGNNWALRAAVLARMEGFDPLLGAGAPFASAEDCDLAYRVYMAGGRVFYDPRICVRHQLRESQDEVARTYLNYAKGRGAFYAKHVRRGDHWPWRWWYWELRDGLRRLLSREGPKRCWLDIRGTLTGFIGYWRASYGIHHIVVHGSHGCALAPANRGARVLVVSPLVPFPADEGRKRRQAAIIQALAKRFAITLVAFGDPSKESRLALEQEGVADAIVLDRNEARGRRRIKSRWLRHLEFWGSLDPWFVRERESRYLRAFFREALATPWRAVVVFNTPISGNIRPWLESAQRSGMPIFLDSDDYESAKQHRLMQATTQWTERLKRWVEWRRIRRYETRWFSRFAQVWVCHDADATDLRVRGCRGASVLPNTITRAEIPSAASCIGRWDYVFVGMMGYVANVDAIRWFVRNVWPTIRDRYPQARLAIVGKAPTPEVQRFHGWDGVTVTGAVPGTSAYVRAGAVSIVPMQLGGGTRIKVLEAFAEGAAVVSTSVGVEGLAVVNGEHCLIADTPSAFAEACLHLLRDSEQRACLGAAAQRLVEQRYGAGALDARLRAIFPAEAS